MITLSNGVEISEETVVNALRKAGIETEPAQKTNGEFYPIATVHYVGREEPYRLILNLPDMYLSNEHKGFVFSIGPKGEEGQAQPKDGPALEHCKDGYWYGKNTEKQVFP